MYIFLSFDAFIYNFYIKFEREREAHVKNLKKLQASGLSAVKTYMNTNLNVSTNTARSDQGIGFDRRKMGNFTTNF